ncbi:MAG: biotin--[acetyl-CoA-carboxylase] ligase [Syntrophomonadaceae bacterium]|nr:biotin--[acetyl-CoA-carboxylase] ligase [Syntrophomonadaceae bacterium]
MRQRILAKLYELKGTPVSGNDLAEELGISRVAVWKHIDALKQEGYDITGVSGKGYSLNDWTSVIWPDEIIKNLNSGLVKQILFYPTLNSTNELAKELLANKKAKEGLVIVAGRQTSGKGRLGRVWESPAGGLWFSIILSPKLPLHELPLLSLVLAVAVASALDEFLDTTCGIKWPNDVFINDKKIAGILLEVSGQVDNIDSVIAGIGININISPDIWSSATKNIATSLFEVTSRPIPNNIILPVVLSHIEKYYNLFITNGFAPIREVFKERCVHLNKKVSVKQVNKLVTGINTDIDNQGNMVVKVGNDIVCITTGDVKII